MGFAAIGILGSVISAVGAISQGQAAAKSAEYQAQVARNNAIIANQNADYAIKAGQTKAETASKKAAQQQGMIKAAFAANGIDVNSGSAVDVQVGQREAGKLDTETTMNNSQLQAYGYRSQAVNFQAEAGLHEAEASNAVTGSFFSAAGGLLGNISSTGLSGGFTGFGS